MHFLQLLCTIFFNICCLRLTPQHLPASSALLGVTSLIYVMVGAVLSLTDLSFQDALLSSLLETGLTVLLTSSLLYFAHYPARILQTLTALLGIGIVIGTMMMPVVFWLYQNKLDHIDTTLPGLLLLGLIIWNLIVYAHVLRHAVMVDFWTGLLLTFVTYSLTATILHQLFPLAD